jgi:DNA-binding transcriptional LysR family regulator
MTKTPAPRVRAVNLYTVEQDGQPVAQAMAISQAEAVRLYVESVQQPTMSARLSSPLEARTLAHLPLLQREPVATDKSTADLFDDAHPAITSDTEKVDPEWSAADVVPVTHHVEDVLNMVEMPLGAAVAPEHAKEPKLAGKVVAKYRNPETGESWSGRGLRPRWLVVAQEAGRALDDFLIDGGAA